MLTGNDKSSLPSHKRHVQSVPEENLEEFCGCSSLSAVDRDLGAVYARMRG